MARASREIGPKAARLLANPGADLGISHSQSSMQVQEVPAGIEGEGWRALPFQADKGETGASHAAVAQTAAAFGKFDILANNVGIGLRITSTRLADDDIDRSSQSISPGHRRIGCPPRPFEERRTNSLDWRPLTAASHTRDCGPSA